MHLSFGVLRCWGCVRGFLAALICFFGLFQLSLFADVGVPGYLGVWVSTSPSFGEILYWTSRDAYLSDMTSPTLTCTKLIQGDLTYHYVMASGRGLGSAIFGDGWGGQNPPGAVVAYNWQATTLFLPLASSTALIYPTFYFVPWVLKAPFEGGGTLGNVQTSGNQVTGVTWTDESGTHTLNNNGLQTDNLVSGVFTNAPPADSSADAAVLQDIDASIKAVGSALVSYPQYTSLITSGNGYLSQSSAFLRDIKASQDQIKQNTLTLAGKDFSPVIEVEGGSSGSVDLSGVRSDVQQLHVDNETAHGAVDSSDAVPDTDSEVDGLVTALAAKNQANIDTATKLDDYVSQVKDSQAFTTGKIQNFMGGMVGSWQYLGRVPFGDIDLSFTVKNVTIPVKFQVSPPCLGDAWRLLRAIEVVMLWVYFGTRVMALFSMSVGGSKGES